MKHLYFIRHGETEFNRAKKWSGSSNVPLTKKGHEQAEETAERIRKEGLKFDVIICSPLERARQTAEHVAKAVKYPAKKIIIDERLVERDFGTLDGKRTLVAATKYALSESAIDDHEGVEPLATVQQRADSLLAQLEESKYESILLVGHGASGRALTRAVHKHPIHMRGKAFANAELRKLV